MFCSRSKGSTNYGLARIAQGRQPTVNTIANFETSQSQREFLDQSIERLNAMFEIL